MKKKLMFLAILVLSSFSFAQVCVKTGDVYKNSGLNISYCIQSLGSEGQCKKWKVIFYFNNTSKTKKDINGSKIFIFNDVPTFPPVGTCSIEDIELQFPWERKGIGATEMNPGFSESSSIIAYSNNDIPRVQGSIVLKSTSATGDWSDWKPLSSNDCDSNLEYSTKRSENYNLNYQLWFYYRVKNNNNKQVSLKFNLTRNSKKEFSQAHIINSNDIVEFMHKMDGDYIDGVNVENVIFTDTKKSICDKLDNNQNIENTPNASLQSAIDEFNNLLPDVPDDSERTNIYERVKSVLANNTTSDSSKLKEVNAAIVKFKNKLKKQTSDNSEKSAQADQQRKEQAEQQRKEEAAQKEVARLQKIKDDKRKSFDNNIASGDSALQSKNYDSALSYYSNAQTYADNDIERSFAKSKYDQAFEARRNAEREVRVAKAKKTDERENVNYAVSSTAMLGAMALLQDSYSNDGFVFKLFLGMGIDSSPLLSNNTSVYSVDKTFIEQRLAPSFDIGAKLEFLNNHSISFFLKPQMTYGMSALNEGTSGGFFSYGGVGCLSIGRHYDSKLSIFAEGGWFRRASSFEYDADAANNGTTTTDDVRSGEYNYKSIRYGGGIMLRFINNQNKETYFRPGFFYEKPDFFTTATKPILNLSMQINISSELIIEFIYAKNTFIPGEPKFPSTVIPEDKNFFGLKIIRQGNLNNL